MSDFSDRLKHAWNAFMNKDPTIETYKDIGPGFGVKPDRMYVRPVSERSIINTIINRFAIDCSSIDIRHVRLDEQGRYLSTIDAKFNNCLTVEANTDQTGRALLYNENDGQRHDVTLPKAQVAIIENPFYQIMNAPNSTMQRLRRKLALLDTVDEQNASKKLNMIIQLPYIVRNETKRKEAEKRRADMEKQLAESKYGVAYMDGTEKITQINRPLDSGLQDQVKYLYELLFTQLGVTPEILNGTANSDAMTNYYNRIIEPILTAICEEYVRKFLTKTARSQRQSVKFFRDPFKLVPVDKMADLADKFTRNEILTSNEVRQIVGMLPSQDPSADELRNKNISASDSEEHLDINGNPIGPGPEGEQGLAEPMPNEPGQAENQMQPQNGGEFEDDPELDALLEQITEEQFAQLPEDQQELILEYLEQKGGKM